MGALTRWRPLVLALVEDFGAGFVDAYFSVLDPNSLVAQGWKWQCGDVSRHTEGNLAALGRITAKTFVMPISEDMFFPSRDCAAEHKLIPNSELRVVEDVSGHGGLVGFEATFME